MLLKSASEEFIGAGLTVASYRQIVVAISRKYLGVKSQFKTDEQDSDNESEEDDDGGDDDTSRRKRCIDSDVVDL